MHKFELTPKMLNPGNWLSCNGFSWGGVAVCCLGKRGFPKPIGGGPPKKLFKLPGSNPKGVGHGLCCKFGGGTKTRPGFIIFLSKSSTLIAEFGKAGRDGGPWGSCGG